MPIKGTIEAGWPTPKTFEIPDPKQSGGISSLKVEVLPGIHRHILWAPSHMPNQGRASGMAYLKEQTVGDVIARVHLPRRGSHDVLRDEGISLSIYVTRE